MIRVVVVDDQQLVRGGFRAILDSARDLEIVGEAGTGHEAVEIVAATRPDVALIDIRMPGMDGIEATRLITGDGAACRVLVLTTFDLDEHVYDAFRAGASGFLLKTVAPEELIRAVRAVAGGDALLAPAITRRLVGRFTTAPRPGRSPVLSTLTDRESDVLALVAVGRSNAEIAETLFIGAGTVKTHIGRLFTKLGVRDRVQAVIFAYEHGVVAPGATDADHPQH